ncbi:MAG: UDP-N-acetylmuramate:L-alanyl-gamma-D-glutamyl-meso-diaminopimelate ligase [Acidobacteriota bacterium]|nr:UDP-N-acetylmuramate:L-alanyl-gamma-D-glutamyl-meso-diaminopimelate ligase [Acidobacteriota bacterium]
MHIHFLGICGTFMSGLALIARELGHRVTGSDRNVYPPMDAVLDRAGIVPTTGYDPVQLEPAPDVVVIGNAMTRGNPCVEHILETGLRYTSGPQWLSEQVLAHRHVMAVAGTHGKTTTTAMLAVILDAAGLDPGFLVAGVPLDFDTGARVGRGGPQRLFVIEADEYDTAFFDKRSKFVHYRPRTLVLNNLEFDHADIFDDMRDIQRQFHHVVRIVPGGGRIVAGAGQPYLDEVLAMGCWTPVERVGDGGDWSAEMEAPDGRRFRVLRHGRIVAEVEWAQRGAHNVANALAAIAAARHAGVGPETAARALRGFGGVRRRLEHLATVAGVAVYDDFAHHPTAVEAAIGALCKTRRDRGGARDGRVLAVLEPASNTMRSGAHRATLGPALSCADLAWVLAPARFPSDCGWDVHGLEHESGAVRVRDDIDTIVRECIETARAGDAILVMSNAGFGGIQERLAAALRARPRARAS